MGKPTRAFAAGTIGALALVYAYACAWVTLATHYSDVFEFPRAVNVAYLFVLMPALSAVAGWLMGRHRRWQWGVLLLVCTAGASVFFRCVFGLATECYKELWYAFAAVMEPESLMVLGGLCVLPFAAAMFFGQKKAPRPAPPAAPGPE